MAERVLVVDDTSSIESIIRSAVEPLGLEVLVAGDFRAAKHSMLECRPDIVFCFISTSESADAGYGFCSELQQHPDFGSIPVVLIAAQLGEQAVQKAAQSGVQGIMPWPVSAELVKRRVELLLEQDAQDAARREETGISAGQNTLVEDPVETSEQFKLAQNILAKVLYQLKTEKRIAQTPLAEVARLVYETTGEVCRLRRTATE